MQVVFASYPRRGTNSNLQILYSDQAGSKVLCYLAHWYGCKELHLILAAPATATLNGRTHGSGDGIVRGSLLFLAVRISGMSSHVKSQHVKTNKQTKNPIAPRPHQDAYYRFLTKMHDEIFFSPLLESKRLPVSLFMLGVQFDCKAVWKFPALRRHRA